MDNQEGQSEILTTKTGLREHYSKPHDKTVTKSSFHLNRFIKKKKGGGGEDKKFRCRDMNLGLSGESRVS